MRIYIRHHTIHFGYRHLIGVVHEKRMRELRRKADLAKRREIPKKQVATAYKKPIIWLYTGRQ